MHERPLFSIKEKVIECIILERINRFTVKVLINNIVENAHINNTGRLSELLINGRKGYCVEINGSKLRYRVFAISDDEYSALIDTLMQERAFIHAVHSNYIPWLKNCSVSKRNYRIGNSIIDYFFKCSDRNVLIETKSAVLRLDGYYAGYPDCPSIRGRKQIENLIRYIEKNGFAYLVFIAGLPRIKGFKPNDDADPVLGKLIREAYSRGVYIKAVNIYYRPLRKDVVLVNPDLDIYL